LGVAVGNLRGSADCFRSLDFVLGARAEVRESFLGWLVGGVWGGIFRRINIGFRRIVFGVPNP